MSEDPRFTDAPVDPDTDRDPADQPVDELRDEDLTPLRELSEEDRVGDEIVTDGAADDPDVLAAEREIEGDDPDGLDTDELGPARDDADGWEPPQQEVVLEQGQTLDEKLAAEVPDDDPDGGAQDADRDLLET